MAGKRMGRTAAGLALAVVIGVGSAACGGGSGPASASDSTALSGASTTSAPPVSTATTATTAAPARAAYGPRPADAPAELGPILLPVPRPDEYARWNGWLDVSNDPRDLMLQFDGPFVTKDWCASYFGRVGSAGIVETMTFDEDGIYGFMGANRAEGVSFAIDCDVAESRLSITQMVR